MMKNIFILLALFPLIAGFCVPAAAEPAPEAPRVRLETSVGPIVMALNPSAAPKTVENFISYVNSGFYDGTLFHRVIPGFMVQGGGFTVEMSQKPTRPPIPNEADNGLLNLRGTVAMARTAAPHSATAQFFINTVDNGFLNFTAKTNRGWGYCVFGTVVEGMEVVEKIEKQPTTTKNGMRDVPVTPVIIQKAAMIKAPEEKPSAKPAIQTSAEPSPAP